MKQSSSSSPTITTFSGEDSGACSATSPDWRWSAKRRLASRPSKSAGVWRRISYLWTSACQRWTASRQIKREQPGVSVLMVTMHENPDYLLEALDAGAAGYVLKDTPAERLINAVHR